MTDQQIGMVILVAYVIVRLAGWHLRRTLGLDRYRELFGTSGGTYQERTPPQMRFAHRCMGFSILLLACFDETEGWGSPLYLSILVASLAFQVGHSMGENEARESARQAREQIAAADKRRDAEAAAAQSGVG